MNLPKQKTNKQNKLKLKIGKLNSSKRCSKQPGYQALFNMVERNIVIHCEHQLVSTILKNIEYNLYAEEVVRLMQFILYRFSKKQKHKEKVIMLRNSTHR